MTHAYDKICLERASYILGRMLDHSVYSLRYDISMMIDLFIASGAAASFERGDIRIIAGMSGIELAYEVLERSGVSFERTQPRHTKSLSPEYWCGYTLAHIQWQTGLPFEQIAKVFSPQAFISGYSKSRFSFLDGLPLDLSAEERSAKAKEFGEKYSAQVISDLTASHFGTAAAAKTEDTPLKKMRIKNGLSQSGLSKASGVPIRTIQQYEQRQKDLSKARAEYLIALARALNCDPSRLI